MSELLFIRHAETDLAGTFCGHSNPPVNDKGRRQIAKLVEALQGEAISSIYTSDLLRAQETASSLAQHHAVPLIESARLREIYFGDWEGLTWTQIEERDPEYARRWVSDFPHLTAPKGEQQQDFERRILDACGEIPQAHDAGRIAVVTHSGVMRVILKMFCGLSDEQAWSRTQSYCCSFTVDQALLRNEVLR